MLDKKFNKPVLKKYAVASLLSLTSLAANAAEPMTSSTFVMYHNGGGVPVNTDTGVTGNVGDGAWSVASTNTFFGALWTAHSGTTFGPGTYTFATTEGGTYTGIQVGAGQMGGHILFNWGATSDIDVLNVWDVNADSGTGVTTYTSVDIVHGPGTGPNTPPPDPANTPGVGMIDGPFLGYHANFSFTIDTPPTAVDDSASMALSGGTTNIDVRANDTDYSGATVTGAVTLTTPVAGTAGGGVVLEANNTITYTPATTGVDTFGYTVVDGRGVASGETTVTVTVTNAPVAYASDLTATAGVQKVISITDVADTTGGPGGVIADDGDGDTLQFVSVDAASNLSGSIVVSTTSTTNDTLTYTPPANINTQGGADDFFSFSVSDGTYTSASAVMSVGVDNALPVADAETSSVLPGGSVIIDVLTGDTDYEDGATLTEPGVTVGNIVQGTKGNAVANGDGTITYTVTTGVNGDVDTFTYTVTDSDGGESAPANVQVTITTALNDLPVAYDSDFTTDAGTAKVILITDNAETTGQGGAGGVIADDLNAHTLSFVSIGAAANGAVAVSTTTTPNDTLTYTPNAGFNGVDTFSFSVNDGIGDSVTSATMTMNVTALRPVANDDTGLTMLLQDVTKNINVVANDTDVEDDATSTPLVTVTPAAPTNGTAVAALPADGTIDYTPTAVGVHTFTYTVTDSDALTSPVAATVTITVTAAPETTDLAVATDEDTPAAPILVTDVATDADGDTLAFGAYDATSLQGGTVALTTTTNADDTLTYTPASNFNGVDSFTYTVSDGVNTSSSVTNTVTVTVAAVEDVMTGCPTVSVSTTVDTPVTFTSNDLLGSCTDVDGTVTLLSHGQPTNGVVGNDGADNLTYTPSAGFVGNDSFSYTLTDGVGGDVAFVANIAVIDNPAIHIISGGNFTMLDATGGMVGGATNVTAVFDESLICNTESCSDIAMTTPIASTQTFFGASWAAHDTRVFAPGTYTFDTACGAADIAAGTTNCGGSAPLTMTVAEGQLGAHMLFDWGAADPLTPCGVASCDIDVAVLWNYNASFGAPIYNDCSTDGGITPDGPNCEPTQTPARVWNWASVDGDSNGKRGVAMVDGPFVDFHANFNFDMTPGYTPPVAVDDNIATTVLVTIDLLANDSDAEEGAPPTGLLVTLDTATLSAGSVLVDNGDGTVDYTPDPALTAGNTDTFSYTITDAGGAVSNVAIVIITIANNTSPVANDVTFVTDEDVALNINITDVDSLSVAVAFDADFDPMTFATFDAATTQGGAVTVDGTNTILTYTPVADFNGTDTLTFTVNDGLADSGVATLTITVNPVNDAVVCSNVTLATATDTALTIATADLIAGCSDIDGDTVTFSSAAQPANAASTVADDGLGTLTYTPETGLTGSDSFDFTATDGNGGDGVATVNIQVGTVYGNFTMLDATGNVFGGTNDVVFTWDGVSMHTAETDVASNMTIVSEGPTDFFGAPWFAHHVRVFGPGTYHFEADNTLCESKAASPDTANAPDKTLTPGADDIDVTGCPGTPGNGSTMSMTIAAGQVGVHMLFDYNGTFDIDVVNVYDINALWNDPTGQGDSLNDLWVGAAGAAPDPLTDWGLVSSDVNGDGINGTPMVDGPFLGFYANFNDAPGGTAPPPEPITTTVGDTKLGGGAINWLVLITMLPLIALIRRRYR